MDDRPGNSRLRHGRFSEPGRVYLLTSVTHQRIPCFRQFMPAYLASRCFNDPALLQGSTLLCWVLMPDHVHWLLQLGERSDLAATVRALKSGSAHRLNQYWQRQGVVWQPAYHDYAIRSEEEILPTARYIVANPLRAGLVNKIGHYPHWDAVWL